jgi:hypothetical protein
VPDSLRHVGNRETLTDTGLGKRSAGLASQLVEPDYTFLPHGKVVLGTPLVDIGLTTKTMPKYKVLKSVAHNLGHSYLSDSNAAGTPWTFVAVDLYERAKAADASDITIDFLNETIEPDVGWSQVVRASVGWYKNALRRLLQAERFELEDLTSATLQLHFDFAHPVTPRGGEQLADRPSFECTVTLVDRRSIAHIGRPIEWLG